MNAYEDLRSKIVTSLSSRFRVAQGVSLPSGVSCDLVASRTAFSWKGLVINSQHILLRYIPTATQTDFNTLFDDGFVHGKRVNRVPLLRGLQFGYMVVPFIAVDSASPELIAFVSSRPRKHWCIFEFPVLHDLSTGKTHYFQDTAMWGAVFFSDLRALTRSSIAPTSIQEEVTYKSG
jgi:hypothetical protein